MAKSTNDDLTEAYRVASKLGLAHTDKLIGILQRDQEEKRAKAMLRKATQEEGVKT